MNNELNITVEQIPQNTVTIHNAQETDYNSLANKPTINGATVEWNKTGHDYSLANLADLALKEDKIDSSHKISSEYVDDTYSDNKFVTEEEKENFVKKDESATLKDGDNYSFIFETDGNQRAHLEFDRDWGLELKNDTADAEISFRPSGEIGIQSKEGAELVIKQKGSNGASIELKDYNAVQMQSGEDQEFEIRQKGSTGAKIKLTTSNGIAMQVGYGEEVTINNSHVVTTNDKSTSSSLGVVQVDGTSIVADSDGVISSVGGTWGSITGTLSDQTDLQNALNAKVSKSGDTMTGALSFGDFSISSDDGLAKIEGSQYGLRVDTTTGLGAALLTANGLGNVVTSLDVKSTYSSSGTDPVNGTAVASAISGKASSADGTTIVDNGSTISTVAVKEQRAGTAIKEWVGTKAQYDAIVTKDANTRYEITDDPDVQPIVVDSALSNSSTNPVQNKVIYEALHTPATTSNLGLVKVDGTTITAAADGTISAVGGGGITTSWYDNQSGATLATGLTISDPSKVVVFKNGSLLRPGQIISAKHFTGGSGKSISLAQTAPLSTANSWLFETELLWDNTTSGSTPCVLCYTGTTDFQAPVIIYEVKMGWYLGSTGTNWNIDTADHSSLGLPDTGYLYKFRAQFTGSSYIFSYKKGTDDWKIARQFDSTTKVFCSVPFLLLNSEANPSRGYNGSTLNMAKTKIIIDGVTWFDGATATENTDYVNDGCTVTTVTSASNDYAIDTATGTIYFADNLVNDTITVIH